eukprot:g5110.t1
MENILNTTDLQQVILYAHTGVNAVLSFLAPDDNAEPVPPTTGRRTGRRLLAASSPFDTVARKSARKRKVTTAIASLVEVSNTLKELAAGRTTLRQGTIFEVIINPLISILSALMPEVIYMLSKEPIVVLIEYILEQLMLPVFAQPALGKLVPPHPGAEPILDKTCEKNRKIKCTTDAECKEPKQKSNLAPCNTGKTCAKDRSIMCNADADCTEPKQDSDLAPCNTGKTCAKDRSIKCAIDAECKEPNQESDLTPCNTGKTCAKDRSIMCNADEDCTEPNQKSDLSPCNTGKTCAEDRSIECANDVECKEPNQESDLTPCNTGKTCAKDRSIECANDAECEEPNQESDLTPCNTGKTCAKDRSIECANDAECKEPNQASDLAPCNTATGKTCAKDRSIECANDAECKEPNQESDLTPCNTGKTCAKDRSIECAIDKDCNDKAPCDDGLVVRKRTRGHVDIYASNVYPEGGIVPPRTAFGSGDVGHVTLGGQVGNLSCDHDCGDDSGASGTTSYLGGPFQPSVFMQLQTELPSTTIPSQSGFNLADEITASVTDNLVDDLSASVRVGLDNFLPSKIRQVVVRSSSRAITAQMTTSLGQSLAKMLVELLTLSMTAIPTRKIVETMVPSLTASIAPAVVHSLTRDPKSDYYCSYCLYQDAYCSLCQKAMMSHEFRDNEVNHFARYYAQYYAGFYAQQGEIDMESYLRRRRGARA